MTIKIITPEIFEQFYQNRTDFNWRQSVEMASVSSQQPNRRALYLGYYRENLLKVATVVILSPVRFGQIADIHGNPYFSNDLADNIAFIRALKVVLKKEAVIQLMIHTSFPIRYLDEDWQTISFENQALLALYDELPLSTADFLPMEKAIHFNYIKEMTDISNISLLLKTFNQNAQRSIKRAKKYGIEISKLCYDELIDFEEILKQTGERKSFDTRELSYYQSFYRCFGEHVIYLGAKLNFKKLSLEISDEIVSFHEKIKSESEKNGKKARIKILYNQLQALEKRHMQLVKFIAIYGNQTVLLAVGQFLVFNGQITFLSGGMLNEFRDFFPSFLLQETMLKKAVELGVDCYDFMGISDQYGDQGVLAFKKNFGGKIYEKSGNYKLMIRPFIAGLTDIMKKIIHR